MHGIKNDPWKILSGLMTVAIVALASWVWRTQDMLTRIEVKIEGEVDAKQDEIMDKFWKIHHWSKDQIDELRQEHNLERASWPEL